MGQVQHSRGTGHQRSTSRRRGISRPAALMACSAIVLGGAWLWSTLDAGRGTGEALVLDTHSSAIAAPRATPTPTPEPYLDQKIPKWAQGRVINDVPVRPGQKVFALTFDDGPWPEYTEQILSVLAQYNVKATFFMVGQEVQRRPQIARAVRDAGHAVGTHSWSHPSRPRDAVAQIKRTDAIIKRTLGFWPTCFRPPYGILKNGMARQAMKEKQAILIWSADSNDWKRPGSSRIARYILNQSSPGGIALMHDGGGSRGQTLAALPEIITTLQSRGYRFVTVPELLKMRYVAPPKPAKKKSKTARASAGKSTAKKLARPLPVRRLPAR